MFAVTSRSDGGHVRTGFQERAILAPDRDRLQRSSGSVRLVFAQTGGVSAAKRVFQQGSAKIRFPNVARGEPPQAVILNTAGGMAGGDSQDIAVTVEENAAATMTTQACERIYHSLGDNALMNSTLALGAGASLEWLPQPVIFFNAARLKREMTVTMASDAILLAVESILFGRIASGETVEYGAVSDAWSIRRGERLIHAERFHIDGAIRKNLETAMVLAGHCAMATLRYVAPDAQARLDEMRALLQQAAIPCAASAWNGLMLVRFVAPDGYSLNRDLVRVLAAFRKRAIPRAWML